MVPNVGIFLMCTVAYVFLQVGHVNAVASCVFPFTYEGKTYFDCTQQDSLYNWCSLDEKYSGIWKYCTMDDRARCFFPFTYKNKLYDSCTTDGSFLKKAWCSVTANYDKDGAWKNCFD